MGSCPQRERIIDPTLQDNSPDTLRLHDCGSNVRLCLRKGCENRYQPRQWNQHFCQAPECRTELNRWRAAKRQRQWRSSEENRLRQAQRERQRRERQSIAAGTERLVAAVELAGYWLNAAGEAKAACESLADESVQPGELGTMSDDPSNVPECVLEPAVIPPGDDCGALSRNSRIPEDFCDRPGCYEPTRPSPRKTRAKYCSDACFRAVQRIRDRERKWRMRARQRAAAVFDYGTGPRARLSSPLFPRSDKQHAQADSGCRPRSPPTVG